jgi:dCTP diphosphatase
MKITGDSLAELRERVRAFAAARDWGPYHTPKNLSMALAVEAAELMEHFQWLSPGQSAALRAREKHAAAEEIADVLIYLVRLADVLGVDPLAAASAKLRANARRYPVSRAKGSAAKRPRRAARRNRL